MAVRSLEAERTVSRETRERRLRQLTGVGNTPLLELEPPGLPEGVRVFGKYEGANPGGSIKDRVALEMILSAMADPRWHRGMTLLEASSGNTALSVARIASLAGLRARLYVPESAGSYRIALMRMFEAELVLTPASEGTEGAQRRAREEALSDPEGTWFLEQHSNPANPLTHVGSTGPEILAQLGGRTVGAVVAGLGTGGTLLGVSEHLRASSPCLIAVPVVPAPGSTIPGLRPPDPASAPLHWMLEGLHDPVEVSLEEAMDYARYLETAEGILAGPSSGAALAAVVRIAPEGGSNTAIVAILPDHARNYGDTSLISRRAPRG
ncbi:PLP-dependent cysteine synthase family protein [Candidatus Fermentibacterales bacterium]|nr:PLP-dependent cysteine synthase family protein [Candidatus Fermentibacterales bacterium]